MWSPMIVIAISSLGSSGSGHSLSTHGNISLQRLFNLLFTSLVRSYSPLLNKLATPDTQHSADEIKQYFTKHIALERKSQVREDRMIKQGLGFDSSLVWENGTDEVGQLHTLTGRRNTLSWELGGIGLVWFLCDLSVSGAVTSERGVGISGEIKGAHV